MGSADDSRRRQLIAEARRHVERGAHAKAAAAYERALTIDATDLRTMRRLADLYARLERTDDARRTYLRVAEGHERRGMVLMAVGALKAILAVDPLDVEASSRLAECYIALGLTADATTSLAALATAHERRGDRRAAIEARRRLAAYEPEGFVNSLRLAELLAEEGERDVALDVYRAALRQLREESPGSSTFLRVAERVLCLAPDDAALMREVGEVHLARGNPSEAAKWLDRSHGLAPSDPRTLVAYARLFESTDRGPEIQAVVEELSRLAGGGPAAGEGGGGGQAAQAGALRPEPALPAEPAEEEAVIHIRMELVSPPSIPPVETPRRRRPRPSTPPPIAASGAPIRASAASAPIPASGAPIRASAASAPIAASGAPIAASGSAAVPARAGPDRGAVAGAAEGFEAEDLVADDLDEAADLVADDGQALEIHFLEALDDDPDGDVEPSRDNAGRDDDLVAELPSLEAGEKEPVLHGELDRLLHGVEVLLEFDALDKAVEVAARAVSLAPRSYRARAALRLARYRAGIVETGGRGDASHRGEDDEPRRSG